MRYKYGRIFLGKPTVPRSTSGPYSIRFGSESSNFVLNSRRKTGGSLWRRYPQAHNPPYPKTPTKFPLTLSSRSQPRDSSPKETGNVCGVVKFAQRARLEERTVD